MCLAHIKPFSFFTRCQLTCKQNVVVQRLYKPRQLAKNQWQSKNIDRGEEKNLNILTDSKISDSM